MTLRDCTLLTCKLVAIPLFLKSLLELINAITGVIALFQNKGAGALFFDLNLLTISYWQITACFLQTLAVIIVWGYAKHIVKRLAQDTSPEMNLAIDEKWTPPVLGITGIVLMVLGISGLYGIGPLIYGVPPLEKISLMGHLITSATQITLGIGIYFGARQISDKLQSYLRAGLKVETATE
jgi:hypothetical protein